jgi:hypothetical protein
MVAGLDPQASCWIPIRRSIHWHCGRTRERQVDGRSRWKESISAVSVIVFNDLMCVVGMMEGMQIAMFAVVNLHVRCGTHHDNQD